MTNATSDSLLAAWDETLTRAADKAAIFNTRGEVVRKFAQLEARARELELWLGEIKAGDVVAIQIGNHVDWPSLLLACLRRGLVALPLERTISAQKRAAALRICRAAAVVAAGPGGESHEVAPLRIAASTTRLVNDWADQPPSLLKLTSGTTAAPRAIRFRSEQLLADCTQICETMGITERDLNFAVIPVSHSYGFSNLITPLLARAVPMVLSGDRMPRAVLDGLARSGATVFPGMPVFYQAFCAMEEVPALDRLRRCISAGAPLPLAVARTFREKFKRGIHSFYGSSECGGICYNREATTLEEGFVGEPMCGLDLQLLEPSAQSSRARVRSRAVGDGYFPEPDEEKLGNGFFIPDDLLRRSATGFCIVGRISDLINVAGKKVNPAEVEAELLRYRGVEQAVVFGRESSLRNEEVAACVVASRNLREAELLEFCRRRLSGWQVPKQIFFVEQIPVNERGKTSRRELARHFAAHDA
jgi:long-chain acyl-CoA synthetase